MKRSKVTYGQLDKVLRSLGFSSRLVNEEPPPTRVYQHEKTGALVMLPALAESAKVFEYHLAAVRGELDNFGIADPTTFAAKLQKAG
jgi:hypothetical protein